jgi:3-deoxy-D-manno-octulosonate 8-phosphate phosphatase (KDO 8-P phosphatase)
MIDLVITDVDGVLTDNRIWVSNSGVEMWAFNQYDLEAVKLLRQNKIEVIALSGAWNGAFMERSDHMNIDFFQSSNKYGFIAKKYGRAQLMQTAFMGNDVIDYGLLASSEYAACPADAHKSIRKLVAERRGYISEKRGGQGCFREWVEYLLLMY